MTKVVFTKYLPPVSWWWFKGLVTGWIPPPTFFYCSLVYLTSQSFVLKVWSCMFLLVSMKIMDFHGDPYCFLIHISLYPIRFLVQRLWCKIKKRTKEESRRGVLLVTSPSNHHQEHWVQVSQLSFEWIVHSAQNKWIKNFFLTFSSIYPDI